ncbi:MULTISPECIES: (R)-mandelonitrile lyase [Haloferax]|uniref:Cupin domain-containing protein n=2 Tax=unclassified Haloferax TaxID=2625095 RepID=A0ACD5I2W1_9EURY|nr:cupin domain-containing protein [Haloferax alexandrinus]RDZ31125.1 cupin domain-containing protein [Haloferax sp. Atlit-48N]RDZ38545.1 cupin domain-containing protein [Haloferax sp. Atlit-47N]
MEITKNSSRSSIEGPAEYFTGSVIINPLFRPQEDARAAGASVTFDPGARTAWHTHPLGQILLVTSGCGLVQSEGGPIEQVQPGDVVWFPPGERHWHGATPDQSMTHTAIQEEFGGEAVTWLDHVTDEEYQPEEV